MATTPRGLSEKQRAMRAHGLGASEVGTALGLNAWKSGAELAAEKRGELPPAEAGEPARWGQRIERPIADEFLDRRRERGEPVSIFTPPTMVHRFCPVLFATPDRILVPEGRRAREAWLGVLEAKNVSVYRGLDFGDGEDEVPEAYLVQVQVQIEVTELEQGWLAALVGGNRYREYPIARDREMGGQLVAFAEKWWADHVVQGLPVPLDGSEAASAYLRRRYPAELRPLLEPTEDARALVARFRAAKAALRTAEEEEAAAGNALRAAIGEAAGIADLCTWKANRPSERIDWQGIARNLAVGQEERFKAQLAAHTTTKPGARVLRLAKGE